MTKPDQTKKPTPLPRSRNKVLQDTIPPIDAFTQPPLAKRPATGQAEFGGPGGPEPTRFGDWERKGRCIDF